MRYVLNAPPCIIGVACMCIENDYLMLNNRLFFQKRKREGEDDGDAKKNVKDTLKDVGIAGKGFVKSIYLLKVPK